MNKTQLIDFIAEKADLSKAQAKAALEATLGGVTDALKDGDQVQLLMHPLQKQTHLLLQTELLPIDHLHQLRYKFQSLQN